ncbi:MAG: heat-inducible transcription repressor HrcA [Cyanobacteria bacterium RYN_339]|nr:heat-inducible transcription repressor HrcA [Cyanobacteria bacterium RYN_339]
MLTPRQKQILKAIVEDYVFTAEPVGSRVLSKKFDFGLSPATLRNEMADLEDEGLLRQPHTSAGRIPSDAGYRLFVDDLMDRSAAQLPTEELRVLERFQFDSRDLNDILAQTAKVTAVLGQCTAIVRAPRLHQSRIQFLQLLPLNNRDVMLVVLTDHGSTISQLVTLPGELATDDLAVLTNFLNAHLRGQALDALTHGKLGAMIDEMAQFESVIRTLWQRLHTAKEPSDRVFVSSASFLAQQPEFGESGKMRGLLCLLEREQTLANVLALLNPHHDEMAHVAIGRENPLPDLHECSMVTATYSIGNQAFGELGLIGPTRLEYPRAMLAVETMARHLGQTLTRIFGYRAGI